MQMLVVNMFQSSIVCHYSLQIGLVSYNELRGWYLTEWFSVFTWLEIKYLIACLWFVSTHSYIQRIALSNLVS